MGALQIRIGRVAGVIACSALLMTQPANAGSPQAEAEDIRKLNIMLMVTSLRCRTTEHDFQEDYRKFNFVHKDSLNGAGRQVRSQLQARYGPRGGKRALDKVGVQIANEYGVGHPWLGCAELKEVTRGLNTHQDRLKLTATARELLGARPDPGIQIAALPSTQLAQNLSQ